MEERDIKILVIGILSMCIIFLGYRLLKEDPHEFLKRGTVDKEEIEISVPRNIKIPKGETIEITWPASLVEMSQSSDESIDDVLEAVNVGNEDFFWQEKAYGNEDGSITLVLTQEQLEHRINSVEETIKKAMRENNDKMEIVIGQDFQSVVYYIKEGCTTSTWMWVYVVITANMIEAQMLLGTLPQNWDIKQKVIAERTGEILFETSLRYENFEITDEEWNQKVGVEVAD